LRSVLPSFFVSDVEAIITAKFGDWPQGKMSGLFALGIAD